MLRGKAFCIDPHPKKFILVNRTVVFKEYYDINISLARKINNRREARTGQNLSSDYVAKSWGIQRY